MQHKVKVRVELLELSKSIQMITSKINMKKEDSYDLN